MLLVAADLQFTPSRDRDQRHQNMKLMKEDSLPTKTPPSSPSSPPPPLLPSSPSYLKRHHALDTTSIATLSGLSGKDRFKFWALAVLLLLALWSMFAGSINLKSSQTTSDPLPSVDGVDVLDVAEREKVVRHLWNVYHLSPGGGSKIRLHRFWQEAFHAAYDFLVSDDTAVRDAAVSEIARMSLLSVELRSPRTYRSTKA